MSDTKPLENPTNRTVCAFEDEQHAEAARRELLELAPSMKEIRVFRGQQDAKQVDTSAKWFADTDVEIARYERALRAGNTVLSIPIADRETREQVQKLLQRHDPLLITHFGEWVTETLG